MAEPTRGGNERERERERELERERQRRLAERPEDVGQPVAGPGPGAPRRATARHNLEAEAGEAEGLRLRGAEAVEAPFFAESAVKRVAWGALFGGLVIGLVVQLALGLLGLAIGASTINPASGDMPGAALGIGSAIWWLSTMLVSMFAGGLVAARLAGVPRRLDGMLHGLVTWGLLTLVMFTLVGTVLGNVIGGAFGALGQTLGAAARGVAAAAPQLGEVGRDVRLQAEQEIGNAAGVRKALDGLLSADGIDSQSARKTAIDALVAQGTPRAEAVRRVDGWTQKFHQAQQRGERAMQGAGQKARQVGERVSNAVTMLAAWLFVALLLGAAAAGFGGVLGAKHRRGHLLPQDVVH